MKESEEGCKPRQPYGLLLKYLKKLLTLPLALLLLILAFIFVLFGQDRAPLMSRGWPKTSLLKTYLQRLLRDIWRGPQTRQYVR